jgi:hypothetical protein
VRRAAILLVLFAAGCGGSEHRAAKRTCARLEADGVDVVERWDEPDDVSVKARDPGGHVVEFSWEAT